MPGSPRSTASAAALAAASTWTVGGSSGVAVHVPGPYKPSIAEHDALEPAIRRHEALEVEHRLAGPRRGRRRRWDDRLVLRMRFGPGQVQPRDALGDESARAHGGRRRHDVLRACLADEGVPLETRVAERLTGRQGEVGDLVDHDLRSTGHDRGLQSLSVEHVDDDRSRAGCTDPGGAVGGPRRARDVVARRDEQRRQRTPDRPARTGQEDSCHGREDYVEPADVGDERSAPRIDARDAPLGTIVLMRPDRPLPKQIAGIAVPQDGVSLRDLAARAAFTSRVSPGALGPELLLGSGDRGEEGWSFDRRILWTASLLHDAGLTTIPRNESCFEVEGGRAARRFLEGAGLPVADAARVERAIVLHMRPAVTLDDGVESVLLDRATGLDVRGAGFELVDDIRPDVVRAFPRAAFDRWFLAAIVREAERRPTCQSARLLHDTGLAAWMARSPWRVGRTRPTRR